MNIDRIKLIYFSPTKTTKTVIENIAQGIQIDTIAHLDLTSPGSRLREIVEIHDELVIIGAPVYSGRVPLEAIYRLGRLKAISTPAVIVVVYGNREYEDALLELRNLTGELGFTPVAGGAFIGEHSYSNDATPVAKGRPDSEDLKKARDFGKLIRNKIMRIHSINEMVPLQVPGNFPYRERKTRSNISPVTLETICTKCKQCSIVCPRAAITVEETIITNKNLCILCCACVKNCTAGARIVEDPELKQAAERLSKNFAKRKEPEIYL
jgi:ferredoxin